MKYSGPRKVRSMYKRQPHVIVVIAYKNGSRDTFAHIAAPNIKMVSCITLFTLIYIYIVFTLYLF